MSYKRNATIMGLVLLTSNNALAHIPVEGMDSFYTGLLHPVLVPAHLLLLVAVGLFFGQQGQRKTEAALSIFAFATIAGLATSWFFIGVEVEALILALSAATGLLIAVNPDVKSLWCAAIGIFAGFSLGVDSAQDTLSGIEKFVTLFGSAVAICLILLFPMALADYFNKKSWQKVGVRIAGSWVTATSFLVLTLSLSAKPLS